MYSDQDQEKKKLKYEKPRLRTIELAAEEVLGVGCKIPTGTAEGASPCDVNNCVTVDTS